MTCDSDNCRKGHGTIKDHIVTIRPKDGTEITTVEMSSDDAHELFAWLTSCFVDSVGITLEQVVPVVVEKERRLLWRRYAIGGLNQHIADAIEQEDVS